VLVLAGLRFVPPRVRFHPASAPLGVAVIWPLVQQARHIVSPTQAWTISVDWLTYLGVFALAADLSNVPEIRRRLLQFVAGFGAIIACVSIVQRYSSGGKIYWLFPSGYAGDLMGPFVNHNQFAAWVELIFPVALCFVLTERRSRPIYGAAAAVLFASVVASTSRAGFLLVTAEAVAVLLAAHLRKVASRRTLVLTAAQMFLFACIACAVVGSDGLRVRFTDRGIDSSLRADGVRVSWQMIRQSPGFGIGMGNWSAVYPRFATVDSGLIMNQAHNDWLQWAAEGGLPFLVFMILFVALLWKPAVQSIYGLGTVALLCHALVDYPMQQRPGLAAWFFAIAGVTATFRKARLADRHGPLRGTRAGSFGVDRGDPPGL
jgi:O-antigen ligase